MWKILCDIARHFIVCTRFAQVSTSSHCSPSFARASCQEQSGPVSFRHVLPMVFWKGCHGVARAIYSRLALCRSREFDFRPKAWVQFSCLQSRPCLPMTWRRDAGIFSINNARDLKLPKRRRSGTCRAIWINRSFDRCLAWFKKKTFIYLLQNFYVD